MRLAPLESILNRHIAASSQARNVCRQLAGKVLALRLTGVPLGIRFCCDGERMTLDTDDGDAAATLSGSPFAFFRLAGPTPQAALRSGAVHIEGDAEVAQAFSELLKHARPDLEEELSRIVGDVAAHQIGNVARAALAFGRRASDTFLHNVAEYLQEEGRDVPTHTEAQEFIAGVDRVREDVDRLAARLAVLEAQHAK